MGKYKSRLTTPYYSKFGVDYPSNFGRIWHTPADEEMIDKLFLLEKMPNNDEESKKKEKLKSELSEEDIKKFKKDYTNRAIKAERKRVENMKKDFAEGKYNLKDLWNEDKDLFHYGENEPNERWFSDILPFIETGDEDFEDVVYRWYGKENPNKKQDRKDIPYEEKEMLEKGKSMEDGGEKMTSQDDIDKRLSDDDFEGSLSAWLEKNPKGREDIPVTRRSL